MTGFLDFIKENKFQIVILVCALLVGIFSYLLEGRNADQSLSSESVLPEQKLVSSETASAQNKENGCIYISDVQQYVGEDKCVRGKIERVYVSQKGTTFLDFCQDYRNCPFSSVIFKASAKAFQNIKTFEGHIVEINGIIQAYQGQPEIVLERQDQIRLVQ